MSNPARGQEDQKTSELKLFSTEDDGKTLDPGGDRLTLAECFNRYLLPDIQLERAAATISGYRTALRHWYDGTTNPVVADVTDVTVRAWKLAMQQGGMGSPTLAKQWRFLRAIFRKIGPRETGNPGGLGLIPQVPYCQPIRGAQKRGRPRLVTPEEAGWAYEACRVATWPKAGTVPAPLLWRTAIVLWYTCGLRTDDVCAVKTGFEGIGWDCVHFEAACPDESVPASSPFGWLDYTPRKTEHSKGEPILLPLTECCAAHLRAISGDRKQVFAVPSSSKSFYAQWTLIQQEAGHAAGGRPYRPFFPHNLRKTCNMLWERAQPGLGSWVLGHAKRGVNERYYTNVIGQLLEALPRLAMPAAFLDGMKHLPAVQLRLF